MIWRANKNNTLNRKMYRLTTKLPVVTSVNNIKKTYIENLKWKIERFVIPSLQRGWG